jgi:hypothetical protein
MISTTAAFPVTLRFAGKAQNVKGGRASEEQPPSLSELEQFRKALLSCVDRDTTQAQNASQRRLYDEFSVICKMWGQCVPVAMAVKSRFGGKLVRYELKVRVNGEIQKQVHWANKIGGVEIDLTSDQYNGDGLHTIDDPAAGVIGTTGSGKLPVEVLEVLDKKEAGDFYYGSISNRTLLLAKRLTQLEAIHPHGHQEKLPCR